MNPRNLILAAGLAALTVEASAAPDRRITKAALEDKIRGGWAGQMIGVSYGAPSEFRSMSRHRLHRYLLRFILFIQDRFKCNNDYCKWYKFHNRHK